MNLEEIKEHMTQRDHSTLLTPEARWQVYLVLADDVPDLVAEVDRLGIQVRDAEAQRDHLIDGIREALTILGQQPSTPELCSVAKAIQGSVNRMHGVIEKRLCGTPKHMTGEPCQIPRPCPNHPEHPVQA